MTMTPTVREACARPHTVPELRHALEACRIPDDAGLFERLLSEAAEREAEPAERAALELEWAAETWRDTVPVGDSSTRPSSWAPVDLEPFLRARDLAEPTHSPTAPAALPTTPEPPTSTETTMIEPASPYPVVGPPDMAHSGVKYLLALEYRNQWVRDKAAEMLRAEKAGASPAFDVGLLSEMLAREPEPPSRIDGLIPSDASTLIVAQRKTGKTTLMLNLARALLTGEDFLNCYSTRAINGRVAFLNFEVSWLQISTWANEVGVPSDRLLLLNLRGRRNPFSNADDRTELAALLKSYQVESLIVDPFGRAFIGKSQNDSGEVGAWLTELDRLARGEAGVSDVILSAHAGWDGERTRGSSALEDWPDSIITMSRHRDDPTRRFIKAEGRDVSVDEDELAFDPVTRLLSLTGYGSRRLVNANAHQATLVAATVLILAKTPGLNTNQLETALRADGHGFQRGDVGRAAKHAVEEGRLRSEPGARNAVHYFVEPVVPSSPNYSHGRTRSSPESPLRGTTPLTTAQPSSGPEPTSATPPRV